MIDYECLKRAVTPMELLKMLHIDVTVSGFALCPWHNDETPSLKVYDDHVYCFACNAYGDIIDILMAVEGMTRNEAVKFIMTEYGLADCKNKAISPRISMTSYRQKRLHSRMTKELSEAKYRALACEAVGLDFIGRGLIPYSSDWVRVIKQRDKTLFESDILDIRIERRKNLERVREKRLRDNGAV